MSYDDRCPRCDFNFDIETKKDSECPNCSLPFRLVILYFYDDDGEVVFDVVEW